MNSSEHFSSDELACKCGCGTGQMDEGFLRMLEAIRGEYGKPMTLSSAFRCPAYNTHVSSSGVAGPHTTGKAVDILCSGGDALEILTLALEEGAQGVGVSQKGGHHQRFVHIDVLNEPNRPWVWSY